MHVICVDFKIKPDSLGEFMPLMMAQAGNSLEKEEGCRRFDVCTDPDDPCSVFLYELYDDEAAFEAHKATDHFKAFDGAVADMVASKTVRAFELK